MSSISLSWPLCSAPNGVIKVCVWWRRKSVMLARQHYLGLNKGTCPTWTLLREYAVGSTFHLPSLCDVHVPTRESPTHAIARQTSSRRIYAPSSFFHRTRLTPSLKWLDLRIWQRMKAGSA